MSSNCIFSKQLSPICSGNPFMLLTKRTPAAANRMGFKELSRLSKDISRDSIHPGVNDQLRPGHLLILHHFHDYPTLQKSSLYCREMFALGTIHFAETRSKNRTNKGTDVLNLMHIVPALPFHTADIPEKCAPWYVLRNSDWK